jgi:hypothetical protein
MHAAVLNWVDVEAPMAFRLDAANSSQRIATATQVGSAFPSGLAALDHSLAARRDAPILAALANSRSPFH